MPFGLVVVLVLGGFLSPHGSKSRLTPLLPSAFQIWDTAGQERFRSVTHAYYRDAHGKHGHLRFLGVPHSLWVFGAPSRGSRPGESAITGAVSP